MIQPQNAKIKYQLSYYTCVLLQTSFASVINIYVICVLLGKNETNINLKQLFIFLQRPGRMIVVSLVQRLLEEIKQCHPLNVNSPIFKGAAVAQW